MFLKCLVLFFVLDSYSVLSQTVSWCPDPRLEHGRVRIRQRAKLAKFVCFPRYELVGNKYATCRNGQWDVQLPVCVRPGCELQGIANGVAMPSRKGAWVVFFCLPGHSLVGSSVIYCDGREWNATAPTCISAINPANLSCDFEDPGLCGWTQDELHDFDWRRLNKKTPSSFVQTGPSYDHTLGKDQLGHYMYIESTSKSENDSARLISPIYDNTLTRNGCFSFFYHMYGSSIGGLRVYQKPYSFPLQALLQLSDDDRQRYILFEKWGNLGDVWYGSVTKLKDSADSFQIVIEGIRGKSFTSDIAIDDVSILQGDNCTVATNAATTPAILLPDSCNGRCNLLDPNYKEQGCGCSVFCVYDNDCCPDFFEVCEFPAASTTASDESNFTTEKTVEQAPQTQKLVATTPVMTLASTPTPTTTSTPKPITTTTVTTKTTPKIITTPKIAPTTKTTTPKTAKAAIRAIPTLVFKTTTVIYNATGKIQKDVINKTEAKPKIIVKTETTTTKTMKVDIKTTKATKTTTNLPYGISRTIENHNYYHEMIDKAKKEKHLETINGGGSVAKKVGLKDKKTGSTSSIKTTLTVMVVILCCAAGVWAVVASRTSRGRLLLATLRGRTSRDPEVRYLTSEVDE